jgi:ankyrin repeat protein
MIRRLIVPIVLMMSLAPSNAGAQSAQDILWDASKTGDTVTMASALADGAKLDALDTRLSHNGRFPLNYAAWFNHPEAIVFLLGAGADIEAVNYTGFTALHHAAESGSLEAARTLLAAGADPEHANEAGWLPVETAKRFWHLEVVALLEEADTPESP